MANDNHRRAAPLSDADAARLKPSHKLSRVTAQASGGSTATLLLYGVIGWDVTYPGVMQALASIGQVDTLDIHICSIGGETPDGFAIYNALARHPAKKIVTIEGLAASMASLIAMVGDTIIMPSNSYLMIHNPSGVCLGEADDMRQMADLLEHMQGVAAQIYADRSGQPVAEVQAMLDAETYLDAEQAVALRFADQVEQPLKIAASLDLSKLTTMPAQMRAALTKEIKMADDANKPTPPAPTPAPAPTPTPVPAPQPTPGEPGALPADDPGTRQPNPAGSPGYGADEALATMRACNLAGFPELAERLVSMRADKAAVDGDVARAKGIKEAAARAGVAQMAAPAIKDGVSLETFRAMAFAGRAASDQRIDTSVPVPTAQDGPVAGVKEIDTRAVLTRMADQRAKQTRGARAA